MACSILVSGIPDPGGGEGGKENREESCINCRPTFTAALSGLSVTRYRGRELRSSAT